MTDIERVQAAYTAVTDFLDAARLSYEGDRENKRLFVTVTGDDFPVSLLVQADEHTMRIQTYSQMPYEIKKEKAVDIAMATAAINRRIAVGKFCLYFDRGLLTYENGEYLSGVGGFTADYGKALIAPAYAVIEQFNDRLYAINKGLLSVKEFLAELK